MLTLSLRTFKKACLAYKIYFQSFKAAEAEHPESPVLGKIQVEALYICAFQINT
jgi:hypothetical protein